MHDAFGGAFSTIPRLSSHVQPGPMRPHTSVLHNAEYRDKFDALDYPEL